MGLRAHSVIVERLEALKGTGLISDYCVTWIGHGGELQPVLRIWSAAGLGLDKVGQKIAAELADFVVRTNIIVKRDDGGAAAAPIRAW